MLRIILSSIFCFVINGCQAPERKQEINETFTITGGDGDQDVLGRQLKLVRIHPDWFDNKVYRGEDQTFIEDAYLLKVISGDKYDTRLIAITSRWVMGLDDQFHENGLASAVVHLIDSDFDNSKVTDMNSLPVGMAVIDKN